MPPPYDSSHPIPILAPNDKSLLQSQHPQSASATSSPHTRTLFTSPDDFTSTSNVRTSSPNKNSHQASDHTSSLSTRSNEQVHGGGIRININNINYNQYNIFDSQGNGMNVLKSLQGFNGLLPRSTTGSVGSSFAAFWDTHASFDTIKVGKAWFCVSYIIPISKPHLSSNRKR